MDSTVVNQHERSPGITDLSNNGRKSANRQKDLICTVCGAPAIGFNFSVITCMCCKAFFRRNALFGLEPLQCRYTNENCTIDIKTRRDCSYCRLKKCFQVGMKKELILTEELKRMKREKILQNRQMTMKQSTHSINSLTIKKKFHLKPMELNFLNNIYNAYEEYYRSPLIKFDQNEYNVLCQQPLKSRIKIQHYYDYYQKTNAFLISFFKCLAEFKQLSDEQQLKLSQQNMRLVMRISLIETINDDLPLWPAVNLVIERIFGKVLIQAASIILHKLKDQINDSRCIRLLVIILLFNTYDISNNEQDTLKLYKIQVKYIELLWSYLKGYYDERIACEKLSIIVRYCLQMQLIGHLADLKREEIEKQNSFLSVK